MPRQTQSLGGFQLLRRTIIQRRMQMQAIVITIDELLQVFVEMVAVAVLVGVNLFLLEGLNPAFAHRVVVGVSRAAHAGDDAVVA